MGRGRGGPRGRGPSILDPWKDALEAEVAADEGRVPRSAKVIAEQVGVTGVSSDTVARYVGGLRRAQRARVRAEARSEDTYL
jgi:hypothetical protein